MPGRPTSVAQSTLQNTNTTLCPVPRCCGPFDAALPRPSCTFKTAGLLSLDTIPVRETYSKIISQKPLPRRRDDQQKRERERETNSAHFAHS